MAQLTANFMLVLVQVWSTSIAVRIYLSVLILLLTFSLAFLIQPYKFRQNNIVSLSLKGSLLMFLILATSFIDQSIFLQRTWQRLSVPSLLLQ